MTKHDAQGRAVDTGPIPGAQRAVAFKVPGKPVGKGRPRTARRGKHVTLYTPEETASYESKVALAASQAMAGAALIPGAVEVMMRIMLPVPVSWSQKKQRAALAGTVIPATKPDVDNVIKAVFDAINGVVWHDDTQVADLQVRRRYGARPGVEMVAMTLECEQ